MTVTRLTAAHLRSIAGPKAKAANTKGVVDHLDMLDKFGISRPQRLAHFIAQIAHESDRFKTTQEYASGAAYEGRSDLGNTQRGDGTKFKGHGLMQITGRFNHTQFNKWCKVHFPGAPDFVRNPKKLMEFPWAMVAAVWYWEVGNPTGKSLNRYADRNDIEMITKRINGGLNGYSDRIELYTRTALVLLGHKMTEGVIARFQKGAGLLVDDISGPATRGALHEALKRAEMPEPADQVPDRYESSIPPEPKPTVPGYDSSPGGPEWGMGGPPEGHVEAPRDNWPPHGPPEPEKPSPGTVSSLTGIIGAIVILAAVAAFVYFKFFA